MNKTFIDVRNGAELTEAQYLDMYEKSRVSKLTFRECIMPDNTTEVELRAVKCNICNSTLKYAKWDYTEMKYVETICVCDDRLSPPPIPKVIDVLSACDFCNDKGSAICLICPNLTL